MAMAARSAARAAMTAAARSSARKLPICPQRRLLCSGGKLLAQAAEATYIQKKEQEQKMQKQAERKVEQQENKEQRSHVSIVDLMDIIEKNEFNVPELMHAMKIIKEKCGPHRHLIEMELSIENKSMEGADKLQLDYVRDVSKGAILQGQLEKALKENKVLIEMCTRLEQQISGKKKIGIRERLKKPGISVLIGQVPELIIKHAGGYFFRR